MTILKKLSIALTLALGIQFSAGASSYEDEKRARESVILVYAQELKNQDNKQAQTIAKWLNAQVINKSYSQQDIIDVITNQNLTEQTKLVLFSGMMSRQSKEAIAGVCGGILLTGLLGTLVWAIVSNPLIVFCPGKPYSQVNVFRVAQ